MEIFSDHCTVIKQALFLLCLFLLTSSPRNKISVIRTEVGPKLANPSLVYYSRQCFLVECTMENWAARRGVMLDAVGSKS